MAKQTKPTWLNVPKIAENAADELAAKQRIKVKLADNTHEVIMNYICPACSKTIDGTKITPQLKAIARSGKGQPNCVNCGTPLRTGKKMLLKNAHSLIADSVAFPQSNKPPRRTPETWIDKAIYGKLIQAVGRYVESFGVFNPQLKFQRGIRTAKFPGVANSAKGAEFTVEFVDHNNTRNRFVVQAGLETSGKFIFPRTFKTLGGNEYPLTASAIENFTGGKLYDQVFSDYQIPPLVYRQPDITRFREISANVAKMVKKANAPMDETMFDQTLSQMGITDPTIVADLKTKFLPNAQNAAGVNPAINPAPASSAFTPLPGLTATANEVQQQAAELIQEGLAYEEVFTQIAQQTGYPLSLEEYSSIGETLTDSLGGGDGNMMENMDPGMLQGAFANILKVAEQKSVKVFHKTADDINAEFDFSSMQEAEQKGWVNDYVKTHNEEIDAGNGVVAASEKALKIANAELCNVRIKRALRDDKTFVPIVNPDPDYSVAEQTDFSEASFEGKYEDMDGGVSAMEDRNYTTMFKGKKSSKKAEVKYYDWKDTSQGPQGAELVMELTPAGIQTLTQITDDYGYAHVTDPSKDTLAKALQIVADGVTNMQEIEKELLATGYQMDDILQAFNAITVNDLIIEGKAPARNPLINEQNSRDIPGRSHDLDYLSERQKEQDYENKDQNIGRVTNPEQFASKLNLHKEAESTGISNSPDDVGQNPINISRLKTMVQDLIRAGNIPPAKVDLHKLKDGMYTRKELQTLVDSHKVNEDTFYPTSHAASREDIRKLAEIHLGDMIKEMPVEKKDTTNPFEGTPGGPLPDQRNIAETPSDAPIPEDILSGGLADTVPLDEFDPYELAKGTDVEMEHTNDPGLAAEVARDHLVENPAYYTELAKMEEAAITMQDVTTTMPGLQNNIYEAALNKMTKQAEENDIPNVPDEEVRIAPPTFLTRKSPEAQIELGPEPGDEVQGDLMYDLLDKKNQIGTLQAKVAKLQASIAQEITPILSQIEGLKQEQLQATYALTKMMKELDQSLIQVGNQVGFFIEKVETKQITPSQKVNVLIAEFGEKAQDILANAQAKLDQVSATVVRKYKQWPIKQSNAMYEEDTIIPELFSLIYNDVAALTDDANDLAMLLSQWS